MSYYVLWWFLWDIPVVYTNVYIINPSDAEVMIGVVIFWELDTMTSDMMDANSMAPRVARSSAVIVLTLQG